MKRELYTITTLSNMHVGSGDINFDIIDRQVQRDAITGLPTIHSSSLKGAYREAASGTQGNQFTTFVFGPDNQDNDNHQTGAYHFFEASLLTRPVRSNKKPYFNATSPGALKAFLSLLEDFGIEIDAAVRQSLEAMSRLDVVSGKPLIFEATDGVILEDHEAQKSDFDPSALSELLGEDLALFSDEDLRDLDLPVLARNSLENGVSQNLWYEEVVPKRTKFYFVVAKPTNLDPADAKENLEAYSEKFDAMNRVQFGANKSIGYGFCKIEKVSQ
jgi:CRISPR-associated protein Cmr4